MKTAIFQVDAFTDQPFAGNPAAVVLLEQEREAGWMQAVAREMNLSETAFVVPRQGGYHLRWFTPELEVKICGHATLAAAHVLWQTGLVSMQERIRFFTPSGWLSAENKNPIIELDFPAGQVVEAEASEEFIQAVGVMPDFIGYGQEKWLFEYQNEQTIMSIKPDFEALKTRKGNGLIITAFSEKPGIDFVSRYFSPWHGVNEDPVTGSAHCLLGPYWGKKLGRNQLNGFQASTRGGMVSIRLSGERAYIGGKAVIIFSGWMK